MAAPASSAAVALPPRYYRDNFETLWRTVEAQYADLLLPQEAAWLATFRALPETAQCLYLRLVSRVGPWFRLHKLDYPEIGALDEPVAELEAAGLLQRARALDPAELGRLYTRAELRQRFPEALAGGCRDKAADLEAIAEWALAAGVDGAALLARACRGQRETLIAAVGREQVALLQLLFFGNRRQSLTEFVLSDLGVASYYPYRLDRAHRLFPDRAAVEDYLVCGQLSDQFHDLRESGDAAGIGELATALLAVPVAHAASERRWWRLFNRVARQLERGGQWREAAALYQRSGLHPARERRARALESLGDWCAAIDLCREILAAPWSEEEREAALRILPRVQRRAGQVPLKRPRLQLPRLDLVLPGAASGVELAVARALAPRWRAVHYVENTLINGLFGLAFWEQIFSPVAGAFHNPFQAAPADMYEGRFYSRRRDALEQRLGQLESGDLALELGRAYERFEGLQCRWVNWRALNRSLLHEALACIPPAHLLSIWRRMLFDPGECRRGFPDLLALGGAPGDYCMIEVKGPGDALQESQKRWLAFFQARDIPAAVAWVSWSEDGRGGGDD
jgi:hypothetical protein